MARDLGSIYNKRLIASPLRPGTCRGVASGGQALGYVLQVSARCPINQALICPS